MGKVGMYISDLTTPPPPDTKRNFHAGTKEDISKNVHGSMYVTEKETLTQGRRRSK